MYVPSLAINAASGGTVDLNSVTIVVGTLVTIYTMLGGIQAVIWNDVIQFCIMFGGLAATAAIVIVSVPGGVGEIFRVSGSAGLLDPFPPLTDPAAVTLIDQLVSLFTQPMTALSLLVALIVGRMAQYTSDQVLVQRLQTTKSLEDTRRAFIVNAAGDALWMLGLSFVGFALFAYFQTHTLPAEYQTDKLLPYFMSLAFPAGAVGLVIAAIMAASLSSIDSAINSCSSVAVIDLYNRLWLGADVRTENAVDQRHQVLVSRIATVLFGVAGTTLACNVSRLGNLIEINARVVNAFTGPLFGIYLLAMFSRRSRSEGVLLAGVAGAAAAYYVAYHTAIGFLWPSTFGLAATMLVGWTAAAMWPAPLDAPGGKLTWHAVISAPVA